MRTYQSSMTSPNDTIALAVLRGVPSAEIELIAGMLRAARALGQTRAVEAIEGVLASKEPTAGRTLMALDVAMGRYDDSAFRRVVHAVNEIVADGGKLETGTTPGRRPRVERIRMQRLFARFRAAVDRALCGVE